MSAARSFERKALHHSAVAVRVAREQGLQCRTQCAAGRCEAAGPAAQQTRLRLQLARDIVPCTECVQLSLQRRLHPVREQGRHLPQRGKEALGLLHVVDQLADARKHSVRVLVGRDGKLLHGLHERGHSHLALLLQQVLLGLGVVAPMRMARLDRMQA